MLAQDGEVGEEMNAKEALTSSIRDYHERLVVHKFTPVPDFSFADGEGDIGSRYDQQLQRIVFNRDAIVRFMRRLCLPMNGTLCSLIACWLYGREIGWIKMGNNQHTTDLSKMTRENLQAFSNGLASAEAWTAAKKRDLEGG